MSAEKNSVSMKSEVFEWVQAILAAVVIAILIRGFIFEHVKVDGSSMRDTLENGQTLMVYKLGYFFNQPKRGDIVVLIHQEGFFKGVAKYFVPLVNPGEIYYIKRVIALPGEEVDIRDGRVYINGKLLDEPYAKGITDKKQYIDFPLKVEENTVFVLGDNRENSSDSRVFGVVEKDKLKGKAVFRLFPFKDFGKIK